MGSVLRSVSISAESWRYIVSSGSEKMHTLVGSLIARKLTLSTAESCTGGLVGALLTEVPGVSATYLGGVISYTNQVKTDVLGVSPSTIDAHTEVSAKTAQEMAARAREKFGSDIAVSATGFAGPGGGNDNDPVGTVYVAAATKNETVVLRLSFDAGINRDNIRLCSSYVIFGLIDRILQKTA